MSHKLQVGEMKASYLTDKEIWAHFNYIFSSKSKNSTTYKFVLIKSILENLYNAEVGYGGGWSEVAKPEVPSEIMDKLNHVETARG